MSLFFHADIVELIDLADELMSGQGCWETFLEAVAQAQDTHVWQRERFLFFRQGQIRSPQVERAAAEAIQAFDQREAALSRLMAGDPAELAALVLEVQRSSQRLARASEDLEVFTSESLHSAFPLLQDLLQAGLNVVGGYESPDVLRSRLPAVVAWVKSLSLDWAQECEDFPALTAHGAEFEAALEELKQGVGALFVFLEEGQPSDLANGLGQLKGGGERFRELLSKIEPLSQPTRSPYRAIERWARLHDEQAQGVEEAAGAVLELLEAQQNQLEALGEIPFDSDEYVATFEQLEDAVTEQAEALEAGDVERTCRASRSHRALLGSLSNHLAQASADLEHAPGLQELRRIVLGVYYRQTPRRFLKSMLDALAPGFQAALAAEAEPEAREALRTCLIAVEHAYCGLQDDSVTDLVDAWRALNAGGSALIRLELERERLQQEETERLKVPCPRCGARNEPSISVCGCGARVLKPTAEPASSLSVSEGSEGASQQPSHVRELLALADRIREGSAEDAEIRAILDPHVARAEKIFSRASQAGASGAFQLGVSKFQAGLQSLSTQADQRDLEELARGVELLLEGSREVQGAGG